MSTKTLLKFILVFVITFTAQCQKITQHIAFSYQKQYPHQLLNNNSIGIVIDEKACDVVIKNGNQDRVVDPSFIPNKHQEISSLILNYLDFNNLQIVEPLKSHYILTFTATAPSYQINTGLKKPSVLNTELKEFYSKITYNCGIKAIIKDNSGNVILNKTVFEDVLLNQLAFKDISDEALIFNKTLESLKLNQGRNYIQQTTQAFYKAAEKLALYINNQIGVHEKKEAIYFYKIGKKKGLDFETINLDIDALTKIGFIDFKQKNQHHLIEKVKAVLPKWDLKLASINANDKKSKKILWAMRANIATAHYILRHYNVSLEIAKKALNSGYRKDYLYLKEFPEEKIARETHFKHLLKAVNKSIPLPTFNNNHKSYLIDYQNTNPSLASTSSITNYNAAISKSKYLYHVFASLAYFNKLKSLLKKFAEKDYSKLAGFKTKDSFFVYVLERLNKEAEALKFTDVKYFNEKEKFLVSKINKDLSWLYNNLFKELTIDTSEIKYVNPFTNIQKNNIDDISSNDINYYVRGLYKVFNIEDDHFKDLNDNIDALSNNILKLEHKTLQKLPYLEMLFSELTDENKLNIQENEKLYTVIFKAFKKNYANIFFNQSDILKHIHHREVDVLNKNLKFYEGVYKTPVKDLRRKYQNDSNENRVLQTLLLFIK